MLHILSTSLPSQEKNTLCKIPKEVSHKFEKNCWPTFHFVIANTLLFSPPCFNFVTTPFFHMKKKSHNGNIFIRKTSFFTKKTKIDWNQNSLQSWKLCGRIEIFEAKYGWILGVNEAWKVMKVSIAKNGKEVSRNGHKVDLKLRLTKIENRV